MKPVPYSEIVSVYRTTEYMTDDQRFASRRPDVMVYKTDILTDDITLTGPLTADLFVSTSGTDADYIVKLIDVFPPDTKTDMSKNITSLSVDIRCWYVVKFSEENTAIVLKSPNHLHQVKLQKSIIACRI